MKMLLLKGWNFMRILRLIMGIVVIVFAIFNHDTILGLAGGFLVLMSVLNIGCCGVGSCPVPARNIKGKIADKETEKTPYEEIV